MTDSGPTAFSVVVPSFNQGRFIDETIVSLLDQNYPDLEIIVVDGGSTDDTLRRLAAYGDRIRWLSEKDEGQSDALVKGFRLATKPWLTWLNSDDIQCNNALFRAAEAIGRHPDADVVFGGGHYMEEDGRYLRPYPTITATEAGDARAELFEKGYVAQPSVFFRKSAYERVGGVNRRLNFCMDYELWVRFAVAGCRFVAIDGDLSGNRWYKTTKTASQIHTLLAEVAAVQVRHFGQVSPYFVQGLSDTLYDMVHARYHGNDYHILYRWLYFKSVWIWLNARAPWYCAVGLMRYSLAKSGPLIGDRLRWRDMWTACRRALARRLQNGEIALPMDPQPQNHEAAVSVLPSSNIKIKRLTREHAEALEALFAQIAADPAAKSFHPHPFKPEKAREIANYPGQDLYFGLWDGADLAGYAMLRGWDAGFTTPSLGIYVLPNARGRDLSRRLIAHLHEAARARGCERVRLKVYPSNQQARRFYERHGYHFEGEENGQLVGYVTLPKTVEVAAPVSAAGT